MSDALDEAQDAMLLRHIVGITGERDALRAEVSALKADLEVAESRKSEVIKELKSELARLQRMERAVHEHYCNGERLASIAACMIMDGLGPDGMEVP